MLDTSSELVTMRLSRIPFGLPAGASLVLKFRAWGVTKCAIADVSS
jgi:hypothetical protein